MLGIAHGDLKLGCGCSAMETHFIKLSTNSYCAYVASRGSLEIGSECCNGGQTVCTHYMLQHSVPFCELVWLAWLVANISQLELAIELAFELGSTE